MYIAYGLINLRLLFHIIKYLPHSMPTLRHFWYFFVCNTQVQVKQLKINQQQFCIFIAEADIWLKLLAKVVALAKPEKLTGFE